MKKLEKLEKYVIRLNEIKNVNEDVSITELTEEFNQQVENLCFRSFPNTTE